MTFYFKKEGNFFIYSQRFNSYDSMLYYIIIYRFHRMIMLKARLYKSCRCNNSAHSCLNTKPLKMFSRYSGLWHIAVLLIFISGIININADRISECPADKDKPWSYDDNLPNGPSHWGEKYSDCKGKNQSPINIVSKQAQHKPNTNLKLHLENYDKPFSQVKIENFGYRVRLTPKDGVDRTLDLDGTSYTLQHLHFHWGNKTSPGSEDEINGNKYTMETHLIHMDKDGKMVAVGFFLEKNNQKNSAIESILDVSSAIRYEGDEYEGQLPKEIDLEQLVNNGARYYRYEGSVGFPPCKPNVTWLVCKANGNVESSQLDRLFQLYRVKKGSEDIDKCHLVNNYRPIQPLDGRTVYN